MIIMVVCVRDLSVGSNVNGVCANATVSDTLHRLIIISYNMHGFNQGRHGIIELISTL